MPFVRMFFQIATKYLCNEKTLLSIFFFLGFYHLARVRHYTCLSPSLVRAQRRDKKHRYDAGRRIFPEKRVADATYFARDLHSHGGPALSPEREIPRFRLRCRFPPRERERLRLLSLLLRTVVEQCLLTCFSNCLSRFKRNFSSTQSSESLEEELRFDLCSLDLSIMKGYLIK